MSNLPLPLEKPRPSTCTLYHGDCLKVMPTLAPQSVQMVFADLPYGKQPGDITANDWDASIDLNDFFSKVLRVASAKCVSLFTAKMKFAVKLMSSNEKNFRHDLVFLKSRATRHHHAKRMPLLCHEHILVFSRASHTYNPIMAPKKPKKYLPTSKGKSKNYTSEPNKNNTDAIIYTMSYPTTCINIQSENRQIHPTQKPVALLEWLIATYTNPGDTVLDPVFGSGTTGVACARLGRNFIGIEKDATYFDVASKRIAAEREKLALK